VTQNSDSSFFTVTNQRFCVTNRASTGDDGDGRYFYLAATVTNLGAEFGSKQRFHNSGDDGDDGDANFPTSRRRQKKGTHNG